MAATSTLSSKRDLRGKRIGRYTLVEHLASGGMAEIFLARHEGDGGFAKDLALKVLQSRYAEDKTVVEMFLAEARIAAKLNHPSVVDVYDLGTEDGLPYIAMEHIRGKTLAEVVRRGLETSRPLPRDLAIYIIAEAAAGLAHMQEAPGPGGVPLGIVHRDISPSNLIIGFGGHTKIIDFGIAHEATGSEDPEGARPGKVSYMSPEQVQGRALDGRSDIFALGTILYEITLGRRLWRGPRPSAMRRIVEERPKPPTYIDRNYPPQLELIVMRALEKKPEDRYTSAEEMRKDLEVFLDAHGVLVRAHHLATYLRELYAPEAKTSAEGARWALAFPDDHGTEDDDELNFDDLAPGAAWAKAWRAGSARNAQPIGRTATPRPTPGPAAIIVEPQALQAPPPVALTPGPVAAHEDMTELDVGPLAPSPVAPRADAPAMSPMGARGRRGVVVGVVLACATAAGLLWAFVGT